MIWDYGKRNSSLYELKIVAVGGKELARTQPLLKIAQAIKNLPKIYLWASNFQITKYISPDIYLLKV